MADQPGASAVERCPSEIWMMIFRRATSVRKLSIHGLETDPVDSLLYLPIRKGEVVSCGRVIRRQRIAAQKTAGRLSLVCHGWYDMLVPIATKRMLIFDRNRVKCMKTLIMPHGEGVRAYLLKSLYVMVIDPHDSDLQVLAVAACKRLEVFHFECQSDSISATVVLSEVCESLVRNCAQTLKIVVVEIKSYIHLSNVIRLLDKVRGLERLSVSAYSIVEPDKHNGVDTINTGSELALRSLSWHASQSLSTHLFDVLARFTLPHLSYMNVFYFQTDETLSDSESETDDEEEDQQAISILPPLASALKLYGPNLKCLVFKECRLPSAPVLDSLLRECPNLLTLAMSVGFTILPTRNLSHEKLERLICLDASFLSTAHFASDRFHEQGTRVRKVIRAFCTEGFPSLQALRIKDVQHCTPQSQLWPDRYGARHVPMLLFQVLVRDVQKLCEEKNIRVVDCTGKDVDPEKFSPTYLWYQRRLEEEAGDSEDEDEESVSTAASDHYW